MKNNSDENLRKIFQEKFEKFEPEDDNLSWIQFSGKLDSKIKGNKISLGKQFWIILSYWCLWELYGI